MDGTGQRWAESEKLTPALKTKDTESG